VLGFDDQLMEAFPQENYAVLPLLFMAHGRKTCKARKPLCHDCPVEPLCLYSHKTKSTLPSV
jgi:endonuclease-3